MRTAMIYPMSETQPLPVLTPEDEKRIENWFAEGGKVFEPVIVEIETEENE